jgi:hypothetical protein
MNDLIQSLPSPSPKAGITHTWMGESWMVDGEMSVMMIVDGFRVARTRGTTRWTQRFERRGMNVGDLGSQRNTVTEASRRRMHNTLQRGRCQALPRFRAVTPQPWDQGGTSVLSAIPWINDSTTEQNEIFIA